ncbi:pentatricopeptide repeat-containing protein [Acrasis kona]|uniref:Pentatricopeptide repeat-containing protein n=1 Tax=Acrasis kona TaxID=1008807 RepID=A0AAW2YTX5_9EUKA
MLPYRSPRSVYFFTQSIALNKYSKKFKTITVNVLKPEDLIDANKKKVNQRTKERKIDIVKDQEIELPNLREEIVTTTADALKPDDLPWNKKKVGEKMVEEVSATLEQDQEPKNKTAPQDQDNIEIKMITSAPLPSEQLIEQIQSDVAMLLSEMTEKPNNLNDKSVIIPLLEKYLREEKFELSGAVCNVLDLDSTEPIKDLYEVLLILFVKQKQIKKAENIFKRIKEEGMSSEVCYNILMTGYIAEKDLDSAFLLLLDMYKQNVKPDVYNYATLLNCCAEMGDQLRAEKLLKKMTEQGIRTNQVIWNIKLKLLGRSVNNYTSHKMFETVKEMIQDGFAPDQITYTTMLNTFDKTKDTDSSSRVLEMIERDGIKKNIFIYNVSIKILMKQRMVEQALDTITDMKQNGFKPDVVTFQTLLNGLDVNQIKKYEVTIKALMEEQKIKMDASLWNTLIRNDMKKDDLNNAFERAKRMIHSGCEPTLMTYLTLMKGALSSAKEKDKEILIRVSYQMLCNSKYKNDPEAEPVVQQILNWYLEKDKMIGGPPVTGQQKEAKSLLRGALFGIVEKPQEHVPAAPHQNLFERIESWISSKSSRVNNRG